MTKLNQLATNLQALFPKEYAKYLNGKTQSASSYYKITYYCVGFVDGSDEPMPYAKINIMCGRLDRLFKLTEEAKPE